MTLTQTPGIAIVKTGGDSCVGWLTAVYNYAVTNTGNVRLGTVTVNDNVCGAATYVSGDTNTNSYLDLTETWHFTCSYVIKATDPEPAPEHGHCRGIGPANQQVNRPTSGKPGCRPLISATSCGGTGTPTVCRMPMNPASQA